jgi:porphobilinogen synthase
MVRETSVHAEHLVMPHFLLHHDRGEEAISSMPGISRLGHEDFLRQVADDKKLGIRAVLLFGLPAEDRKDEGGSGATFPEDPVLRAVSALRREYADELVIFTDVCLCAYTDHGHCGYLENGVVANDPTLVRLAEVAVAHARAGAHFVAPSDMMDGRVAAIRDALDDDGLSDVGILSYAVKYASSYYGPFREAADSAPGHGDRKGYQMDPANVREALKEAALDEAEGADMLMVKPALAYLDVIRAVRHNTRLPLAAYNVSGEYSLVKAAAERGWLDEEKVVHENLQSIRRAGADLIITYHAREALQRDWL